MDALFAQLAQLPPDVNPYPILKTAVHDMMIAPQPDWFLKQLYVNACLFGVLFLISAFALILRYKDGTLWFYKRRATLNGKIIVPNSTTLVILFSFMTSMLGLVTSVLQAESGKGTIEGASVLVFGSLWVVPLLFGVWCDAHAMCVAMYLAKPDFRVRGTAIPSWLLNFFFLGHLPAHLIVAVVLGAIACARMDIAFQSYNNVNLLIDAQIMDWAGAPFQITPSLGSRLGLLQKNVVHAVTFFTKMFQGHLALHISVAVVFLPSALLYLRLLQQQLRKTDSIQLYASRNTTAGIRKLSSVVTGLKRSYQFMLWEVLLIALASQLFLAVTAYTALKKDYIFASKKIQSICFLIAFYLFSGFGILVNSLIAYRAWAGYNQTADDGRLIPGSNPSVNFEAVSLLDAIKISSEQVIHIDQDLEGKDEEQNRRDNYFNVNLITNADSSKDFGI